MNDTPNSVNQSLTIDDIINEIKQKSAPGDYIYRGERKSYKRVSSALYREYFDDAISVDFQGFDLRDVQREILSAAKKHIGETPPGLFEDFANRPVRQKFIAHSEPRTIIDSDELEILTELQHYGGKTNLIDFTTDYLIAIFFACNGSPKKEGRVILQQRDELIEKSMIIRPQNPQHRVIAQKSVFLYPPHGVIDVFDENIVYIPAYLKHRLLEFLRKYHDISAETIYNDIHGFIINQDIHQKVSKEFYLGKTFQHKANEAKTDSEKQDAYKQAIKHYDLSIELNSEELNSENLAAYHNRGECRLHLQEWEKAMRDLTIAHDMGANIAAAFHKDYGGIKEFKKKTGIEIPYPITMLLGSEIK